MECQLLLKGKENIFTRLRREFVSYVVGKDLVIYIGLFMGMLVVGILEVM